MIKSLSCAAGALVCALAVAPLAKADGFYVNPEWNGAWSGSDFGGSVMDAHVGYEAGSFYIQGGPSWVSPQGSDTELGFSAKTGVSAPVADRIDVYGEVSYAKYENIDAGYGLKIGGKVKL